ncbi:unnamed protein product [Adineta ricciae]|uniref:Uncharacterized protein n=1 Tax=Adineta ricciae TaxID=249248 RepID=A0A814FKI2_ADIRI|nr:unnamed protein product [Adineta ricciae]
MASITSIISIFVLLLATYCHSAPIETEFQFSTVENELTSVTPKPIKVAIEFNTVPNTHSKRLEGHSIEQFTTERSIPEKHNSNKRTLLDEFTTVSSFTVPTAHKRSDDDSSEEFTTVSSFTVPMTHKRSDDDSSEEFTTVSSFTVPMTHKRSDDDSSEEFTTELSHVDSKRGSDEVDGESTSEVTVGDVNDKRSVEVQNEEDSEEAKRSIDEWTTEKAEMIDGKQKRTEEHTFPNEFFTTVESSTDFNNRVVRLLEHEPVDLELTTIPESSSFETLAHTTGLLKQRHVPVPETETPKGERTDTKYISITENVGTGETRDTEYFRANDLSTFNQTAHEQYSSSFNDESILLLFLLAALLFCIIFVASFIAFNQMKKNFQRQSPINEMEAELDKQYDQHES